MFRKIGKMLVKEQSLNFNKDFKGIEYNIDFGIIEKQKQNLFNLILCGIFVGFINGFWGGGGGMICVPVLTYFLKIPEKIAHATTILIILPLTISSLIIYLLNSEINLEISLWVGIGFVLGGLLGALLLKKVSNLVLKIIFDIIIIAGGIRLLF